MKKFILCLSLLLLVGCQTKYGQYDKWNGGGYKETKIAKNKYRVYFYANSRTESEIAFDYALRRAAELTLQNGYTNFILLQDGSYNEQNVRYTPSQVTTENTLLEDGVIATTTHTTGPKVYVSNEPTAVITIMMVNDTDLNQSNLYDAQVILRNPLEE